MRMGMGNRTALQRTGAALAVAALFGSLLAGCSNSGSDKPAVSTNEPSGSTGQSSPQTQETAPAAPFNIKMTVNFDGKEAPKNGNDVELAIEKYTNTNIEINVIASNDYCTKLPVMIASGEMPQVISSCGAPIQSNLISAIQGDTFWDITDLIKDYKNLSSMPQLSYDNVKVDGRLYGIPRARPVSRNTFVYRQDWLQKLELKEPQSIDEFYNVLKAFTEDDPDGNNKKDTYGMSIVIVGNAFIPELGVAFGAPNNWGLNDGKIVKAEETAEYLESLKFLKKLYDEGIINRDFASIDRAKQEGDFENGKSGSLNVTTNTVLGFEARVKKVNANAAIDFFSALEGPNGTRLIGDRGSNGILMFPKSSVKTEEELKQLLSFFDKLGDHEMADLLEWGIQGVHYELKDGKPVRLNQERYDNEISFPYNKPLVTTPLTALKTQGDLDPISSKALEVETANTAFAVADPTMVLISETWTQKGAELVQLLTDAKVKFIMGKIDENGWNKELDKYRKAGGTQAAEEYAAAAAKIQK